MHIVLASIGGVLMIPMCYLLFAAAYYLFFWGGGTSLLGDITPGIMALLASCCASGIAWSSLCLLFFKKTDARWQRICWAMVSAAGWITSPTMLGWWIYLSADLPSANEVSEIIWIHLILLFITAVALQCGIFGARYSRDAGHALRTPPNSVSHLAD